MPDPSGRWLNTMQWQCPKCAWVNESEDESCQKCERSVRPPLTEPVRPLDPLDLISHDETRAASPGLVEVATTAIHTLTRVTHEKAAALIGKSLRSGLNKRGERGELVWQLISELPEDDQRAALGDMVDDLESEGFALYRFDEHEPDGPTG